jgi:hypothetical protein
MSNEAVRVVGVDIGTGMISCATRNDSVTEDAEKKKIRLRKVRDAFMRIDPDEFMAGNAPEFGEKMLRKTGTHFIKLDDVLYILGDSAYEMSIEMNKELLRPMAKGVLNPNEPESAIMVEELIKAVAGEPENPETDVIFYCVPADPIDADYDVAYHKATCEEAIRNVGYKNVSVMNEGLAVVYSELYENNFTGIGISFGAGMCNVSYANRGIEILSFSVSKGGDYIDQNAAKQVNDTVPVMTYRKEDGMSILDPQDEYEKAISVYYKTLIQYLVKSFVALYKKKDKKELPRLFKPIPLVVSGGTSLVGGFLETLEKTIREEKNFPIKLGEIRCAEEQLYAVAAGLYQAGKLNSELS